MVPDRRRLRRGVGTGIRYLLDPRVVDGTAWITGANTDEKHVHSLVAGRDFFGDGFIEVADVRAGDPAPDGSGPVELARGMEIGHVFQLGRFFADVLGLRVLDENGKLVTVTMGSYGIGVTRILAIIAELNSDEKGLIWPFGRPVRRARRGGGKDPVVFEVAERLSADLEAAGLDVLFDDRPKVSPGVKFGDAEIVGVPRIVVVGRAAADGRVELWDRRTGDRELVSVADAVAGSADADPAGRPDRVPPLRGSESRVARTEQAEEPVREEPSAHGAHEERSVREGQERLQGAVETPGRLRIRLRRRDEQQDADDDQRDFPSRRSRPHRPPTNRPMPCSGISILLRNVRRAPITTKAMPVMPIPRPTSPRTIGPPGTRRTPRLATSTASSASTRAPRATDAAIRPSTMKIAAWPHAPTRRPHFAARPCASSDGRGTRIPSSSCQMPNAHSVIAISHNATNPSGAPAIAMRAPD